MRERGAQRILQIVVAAGLLLATVPLAHGQRLPFPPGSTIRVANLAGVSNTAWVTGTVMSARRDFLHVDPLEPGAQFAFRLKDSMRLQVRRGRSGNLPLGEGIGLAVGAASGVTLLSTTLGGADARGANVAGAVLYGAIGALLGAFISSRVGPANWEDVTIVNGRVPVAPLSAPETVPRSFYKPYYWTRFDPTLKDFKPFFEEHAAQLHPIEGIWSRRTFWGMWNIAIGGQIAIVRDASFDGFNYVAFDAPRCRCGSKRSDWGGMVMALGGSGTDTCTSCVSIGRPNTGQPHSRQMYSSSIGQAAAFGSGSARSPNREPARRDRGLV